MTRGRKRHLGEAEFWLVREIGEGHKAFGMWPTSPELVPVEVAARAAEMAYRRGVSQGAFSMLWRLRDAQDLRPGNGGEAFARRLRQWRVRGYEQRYAKAEPPPDHRLLSSTSQRRKP